jgi:hypothetical protein
MGMKRPKSGSVTLLSLTRPEAERLIRRLASDSGRVYFTDHAKRRMKQRHITPPQVMACLLKGRIVEGPALSTRQSWEMKFERSWSGELVQVVAALQWDTAAAQQVIVVTVIGD